MLLACLAALLYGAYRGGLLELISTNAAAQFTYLGIGVLYFACGAPSLAESAITACGGLAILWLCPVAHPSDFVGEALVRAGAFVGVATVAALSARAILGRKGDAAGDTLARSLIFIVLGITLGTMLSAASRMRPYKYDLFLYAIDARFGAAISFAAGRLLNGIGWLRQLEICIYHALPLAFAILYAAHIRRSEAGSAEILIMMCLNAVLGYGLYFVYPAAGPWYTFGAAFPNAPPAAQQLSLHPVLLDAPPNAMPSLHLAGAVLIWWNARYWRLGWLAALAFLILTAIATLGLGEHYFLDLVVALPYALAIQAAAVRSTRRRLAGLLVGIAMTAGWLGALAWLPAGLLKAPVWLMWALAGVSVGVPATIAAVPSRARIAA